MHCFLDDDFVSDCDLFIACVILKKQIELIDGKIENIIIPSVKMREIQQKLGLLFFHLEKRFIRSIFRKTRTYTSNTTTEFEPLERTDK